jgi:hypothetical protein
MCFGRPLVGDCIFNSLDTRLHDMQSLDTRLMKFVAQDV